MAEVELRRASVGDSGEIAALFRLSRKAALPYLPELHTKAEDHAFFRDSVFATCELWVAALGSVLVGLFAFRVGWIDHLYVHPAHHGCGIGSALLLRAKETQSRLELWTFERNLNARRFYEARDFRCVRLTDGHDNEEHEPDALYQWTR